MRSTDFVQYFFKTGMPVESAAQRQNDAAYSTVVTIPVLPVCAFGMRCDFVILSHRVTNHRFFSLGYRLSRSPWSVVRT